MFNYTLYFDCEFDSRNYIHWELDETRKFLLVAFVLEERMSTWCLSGLGSQQTWTGEGHVYVISIMQLPTGVYTCSSEGSGKAHVFFQCFSAPL